MPAPKTPKAAATVQQVPADQAQVEGQVLFYGRPEPLSPEAHGKLGFRRMDTPFAFASRAQAVPLQVTEFGLAAGCFPIIFAGEAKAPMAIMGLRAGENLFISPEGRMEDYAYVPAFMRRYPFVLAGDEGQEQMIVCIDRDAPMLMEGGDAPLFENGQLSSFGQTAVDFCRSFETERQRTDQFVARLKELDLFEPKATTFTPRNPDGTAGQPVQLADYFAVSEEKLRGLSDADLRDLLVTGALLQIHAHMTSLFNWERIIGRAAARQGAARAANA